MGFTRLSTSCVLVELVVVEELEATWPSPSVQMRFLAPSDSASSLAVSSGLRFAFGAVSGSSSKLFPASRFTSSTERTRKGWSEGCVSVCSSNCSSRGSVSSSSLLCFPLISNQ
uniref:Putative secreted peptide n=1 Tax=Anopheles braziliensis TaxID=58242 RepID=A0A2M3ZR67_9DIPT